MKKTKIISYKTRLDFGKYSGEKAMNVMRDDPDYLINLHCSYHSIELRENLLADCMQISNKKHGEFV